MTAEGTKKPPIFTKKHLPMFGFFIALPVMVLVFIFLPYSALHNIDQALLPYYDVFPAMDKITKTMESRDIHERMPLVRSLYYLLCWSFIIATIIGLFWGTTIKTEDLPNLTKEAEQNARNKWWMLFTVQPAICFFFYKLFIDAMGHDARLMPINYDSDVMFVALLVFIGFVFFNNVMTIFWVKHLYFQRLQ